MRAEHVTEHGGNPRNLGLYGQEDNGGVWSISKMNMILHGIPDADLVKSTRARLDRGFHRRDVAPDHRGDVPAAGLLILNKLYPSCFHHGVGGFHHRRE